MKSGAVALVFVLVAPVVCLTLVALAVEKGNGSATAHSPCQNRQVLHPEWIWCDDFEVDRLREYFEYNPSGNQFIRVPTSGVNGSVGMRVLFLPGQAGAGWLHLAFGKTPFPYFRPVDTGTAMYREIYWQIELKNQPGWVGGGGDKLARAIVFAGRNWEEAAIGHIWSGSHQYPSSQNVLLLDPASGTDEEGTLKAAKYNDFENFRWLGVKPGVTRLFDSSDVGRWYCIEVHMKLNSSEFNDGVFEYWVNDELQAQSTSLNWLGNFTRYGVNALFIENYWNAGPPVKQERYLDNLIVSTKRIGCSTPRLEKVR